MDPSEAPPDLVGRTSARLHAMGVERRERLESLHLLAILDASANDVGRIRRPLDDLADEFELPAATVMRSIEHLERSGALRRDGGAVQLLDRDADGVGGMHLADFLDDVRAVLDDQPLPHRTPWLARAGAGLVALTAAIGILTLAPSQPTGVNASLASSTTTALPEKVADDVERFDAPAPTTIPSPAQPSAEIPADDPFVVAAATCPEGEPTASFDGSVLRITNPTSNEIVVTVFSIGGVPTARSPITVPAGESVEEDTGITSPTPLPASIDEWDWTDPTSTRSCPTD